MRLRVLAVSLLAFFALAGSAQASTTIIEPVGSLFPYQRWIDESLVPTPDVTIEVVQEEDGNGCPSEHGPFGNVACTAVAERTIWIAASQLVGFNPRETFMHEIGHNFDADAMPEWARERFDAIYGLGGPWEIPGSSEMTAGEWFAEAYAQCAVKPYVTRQEMRLMAPAPIYGSRPLLEMRVAHNKACRMIQNL